MLGVVFFPTKRSAAQSGTGPCGNAGAVGCSFIENTLGEHKTATIHAYFAIAFIICLAVMSFLFAISEVEPTRSSDTGPAESTQRIFRKSGLFFAHTVFGLIILAAGAWAIWGASIGQLTSLYIGEVASVWAFGVSWLLAGFYLTAPWRPNTQ